MFENIVVWLIIITSGLYLLRRFYKQWKTLTDSSVPDCGGGCSCCTQQCDEKKVKEMQ